MSEYNPDVWVIVELAGTKVTEYDGRYHRVLAGWYGGYGGGDSWKMNSGIRRIVDKGNHYEVHGDSGSVYNCYKEIERFSGYTASIYRSFTEQNCEAISVKQVEMKDILEKYLDHGKEEDSANHD